MRDKLYYIFSNQQRINAYNAFSTKALHELIECEDEKRRSIHLNTSAKLLSFLIEKSKLIIFCVYMDINDIFHQY